MKVRVLTATFTIAAFAAVAFLYTQRGTNSKSPAQGSRLKQEVHPESVESVSNLKTPATVGVPECFADLPPDATGQQLAARIHKLGREVSEKEQAALFAWIAGAKPDWLPNGMWLYVRNEVLDALCHQNHPLHNFSDALIGIVRDPQQDGGLRDYAIQHIVDWVEPTAPGELCEVDARKREAMIAALVDASRVTNGDLAGTAVLGLKLILDGRERGRLQHQVSADLPLAFSEQQLRPIAVSLVSDKQTTIPSRITALQVCAQHRFAEALPVARQIAADKTQPFSLRVSAIAALGSLGNPVDAPLLAQIEDEGNTRFSAALHSASSQLTSRDLPR